MDMQGTPIGGPTGGTKNTSDPRARDPNYENPGGVTSDSLAAESDSFQSANPNSNPTGVTGASSTYGNTDTSGATRLKPAADANSRDGGSGSTAKYPEGLGGQGDANPPGYGASGLTSATGGLDSSAFKTQGPSTSGTSTSSGSRGIGGDSSSGAPVNADAAPGYITSVVSDNTGGPKGRGLKEGDFEGEAGNTLGAEPGSLDDPARVQVQNMMAANARVAGGDGGASRQNDVTNTTQYDSLRNDQNA